MLPGDGRLVAAAAAALPLAHGDLSESDAAELRALKALVTERAGVLCDGYKEKCLRRRIAVRMRARSVHTYAGYADLLESDDEEFSRLLDAMTINVSKFFRNNETWDLLRRQVVPELFSLPGNDVVRIWSAGVAGGEEAYTFAILLHEYAHAHGLDTSRFRICGTDIDRQSLLNAARAEYGEFSFTETDETQRARWFEWQGTWRPRPEIRAMVEFGTLDLMRDPFPAGQHVILCRNVIIYFERSIQETLFQRFAEALVPGGYLVLGKVEALFGPAAPSFQAIAGRERIFRRP
jgi:chemotaxis protein methyltransferase CheR